VTLRLGIPYDEIKSPAVLWGETGEEGSVIVSAPARCFRLAQRATLDATAAFILPTLASPCFSGVNAWTAGGPAGESVGSIVIDLISPQTLCAVSREVHP